MNEDYRDLLSALVERKTRFLGVGAHASGALTVSATSTSLLG